MELIAIKINKNEPQCFFEFRSIYPIEANNLELSGIFNQKHIFLIVNVD